MKTEEEIKAEIKKMKNKAENYLQYNQHQNWVFAKLRIETLQWVLNKTNNIRFINDMEVEDDI